MSEDTIILAVVNVSAAKDYLKYGLPKYPPEELEHEYIISNCERCKDEVYIGQRIREVKEKVEDSIVLCMKCIAKDDILNKQEVIGLGGK